MSGICGICEPRSAVTDKCLHPMLDALALPDDRPANGTTFRGGAFGVVARWPGHELASFSGTHVALYGDLVGMEPTKHIASKPGEASHAAAMAERIAHLYKNQGLSFLHDLEGGFSVALWDEREQRLVLAIDRMGIYSSYWVKRHDRLLFASRLTALSGQSMPSEVDPEAVMQFLLFTVVPAPLTIYRGIQKLQPGHALVYSPSEFRQFPYWDVSYCEDENHSEQDWAAQLRKGMRRAVHTCVAGRNSSDTGAYLSGGTDSSSVVAFASEKLSPLNALSIYFSEERYSEIGYARITASRFGAQHWERRVSAPDALDAIPKICSYYGEPFANSSAIGAYWCARTACENGIDTLLAGDGGDEIFAGNERYASDLRFQRYHHIPALLRKTLIEPVAAFLPESAGFMGLPKRYIRRSSIANPKRIFSYSPFLTIPPEEIFDSDFLHAVPASNWFKLANEHFFRPERASELNRMMYLDLKLILADNDLRKVVGTAELAGVRARFPLLDRGLVELTARIPSALKMRGSEKRYIFQRAMSNILPAEVLNKKKHGFGVPLGLWLQQEPALKEMMNDLLSSTKSRQRGYVKPDFIEKLLSLHGTQDAAFYGETVWTLVVLELWHHLHRHSSGRSECLV